MNVVLAVTIGCFFILCAVPLPADAIKPGRIFNTLIKEAIETVQYNTAKNDITHAPVSLMEAWALFQSILTVFKDPNRKEEPKIENRDFNPLLDTWIVVALYGGNGINGILAGILNHIYGGQTFIIAGRTPTEEEWQKTEKDTTDTAFLQRKKDLQNYYKALLATAQALGIPVLLHSEIDDSNVDCLWSKFNKTHTYVKCAILLESTFGKGQDGKPFEQQALPLFHFIKLGVERYQWQTWGTDGAGGARLSIYLGDYSTNMATSISSIPKCDYATLFYGLSGLEAVFMKSMNTGRIFLATNTKVSAAISSFLPVIPTSYDMEHTVIEVVYNESLEKLTNSFYGNLSDLLPMLGELKFGLAQ